MLTTWLEQNIFSRLGILKSVLKRMILDTFYGIILVYVYAALALAIVVAVLFLVVILAIISPYLLLMKFKSYPRI